MSSFDDSPTIQNALDRFYTGDRSALNELLGRCRERLRLLAHQLLGRTPVVRADGCVETSDLLNEGLIRINTMVTKVRPATPRDLFKLACQNIQWALDDIRKRVLTKRRKAPGHRVDAEELAEQAEHYDGPEDLAIWTEFHQSLSELPEEARELWNLHYYLGLSPAAVAQLLGVPRTTLRRRWIEAMASLPLEDIPPIGDE